VCVVFEQLQGSAIPAANEATKPSPSIESVAASSGAVTFAPIAAAENQNAPTIGRAKSSSVRTEFPENLFPVSFQVCQCIVVCFLCLWIQFEISHPQQVGPRLNLEAFRRPSYSTGITSPQSSAEASKGAAASFSFGVNGADMMRRAATIAATRAFAAPLDHASGAASWRLPMDDRQASPRVATAGAPLGLSSIDALSIKSGYDAAILGCCIFCLICLFIGPSRARCVAV
jgi:hypothetical protein